MQGGAAGRGVRGGRTVGDVRDEELDDAIDMEIEKVRQGSRSDSNRDSDRWSGS